MTQPNFVLIHSDDTIRENAQYLILKQQLNDKQKSKLRTRGSLCAASRFVRSSYGKH